MSCDLLMQGTVSVLEHVTPYKICVMMLLQEYCLIKAVKSKNQLKRVLFTAQMKPELKRDFCMLALQLTQSQDMEYGKLIELLESGKYSIDTELLTNFTDKMSIVLDQDVGCLFDIFSGIDRLTDYAPYDEPMIYKSSKIGIYMRRIRLFFDKLSFDETVRVYRNLRDYLNCSKMRVNDSRGDEPRPLESQNESQGGMDLDFSLSHVEVFPPALETSLHESKLGNKQTGLWSKQQVDYFVSNQAKLLVEEPALALPPQQLQSTIHQILTTSSQHIDAHYLSYLNSVRSKEFNGALSSLYHYFDRKPYPGAGEDDRRALRLAALNLAILHTIFNRNEEALAALNEAVTLAHEANDNTTLQYCQTWLHILNNESRENMFDRCLSKCEELNLNYLLSFTYQAYAQASHNLHAQPARIFQLISKSESTSSSVRELSLIQHAALWSLYGQPDLASLCSQRLLCLSPSTSPSVPVALAILIQQFALRGDYEEGARVLEEGRSLSGSDASTSSGSSSLATPSDWLVLSEGLLMYNEALHRGHWQQAIQAIRLVSLVDNTEASLKRCEVMLAKGDRRGADKLALNILGNKKTSPVCQVRALRLLARCDPPSASLHLSKALVIATSHYLRFYIHLISFDLLARQIDYGRGSLDIDGWCVLSNCSYSHVCDCLIIHAKARVLAAAKTTSFHNEIAAAVRILDRAQHYARAVQDFARLKNISYLQSVFCDNIGMHSERNKYSFQFRTLDEQFPSYNASLSL